LCRKVLSSDLALVWTPFVKSNQIKKIRAGLPCGYICRLVFGEACATCIAGALVRSFEVRIAMCSGRHSRTNSAKAESWRMSAPSESRVHSCNPADVFLSIQIIFKWTLAPTIHHVGAQMHDNTAAPSDALPDHDVKPHPRGGRGRQISQFTDTCQGAWRPRRPAASAAGFDLTSLWPASRSGRPSFQSGVSGRDMPIGALPAARSARVLHHIIARTSPHTNVDKD